MAINYSDIAKEITKRPCTIKDIKEITKNYDLDSEDYIRIRMEIPNVSYRMILHQIEGKI